MEGDSNYRRRLGKLGEDIACALLESMGHTILERNWRSGHLEIGKVLLGVETTDDLLFTTMVHAATVLSTIVVFRKQIWDLLKGVFKFSDNDQMDYVLKIAVSMIPVLIVGLFF